VRMRLCKCMAACDSVQALLGIHAFAQAVHCMYGQCEADIAVLWQGGQ
jgi:hypothetical protein